MVVISQITVLACLVELTPLVELGVNMVTLQIMVLTRFFELTRVLIEHVFWADTLF